MTETLLQSHGAPITATHRSSVPTSKSDIYTANPSGVVVGLTLSMGWQLAVVVLVPIFGGHVLDDTFNTAPVLTIIGLLLAMVAMVLVVRRTLAQLAEYTGAITGDAVDKKVAKGGTKS